METKILQNAVSPLLLDYMRIQAENSDKWNFKYPLGKTPFHLKHAKLEIKGDKVFDDFLFGIAQSILICLYEKEQKETGSFFIETPPFFVDQLPTDSLAIAVLAKNRKQAYLDVGILYKERFDNTKLAFKRLTKLLTLNPTKNQEVSALYHCFKLLEKTNMQQAESFKAKILTKYPDSPFALIIQDPANFSLADNQTPTAAYERLYRALEQQDYQKVLVGGEGLKIIVSGTKLSPKVAYLQALAIGRLEGEIALINALKKLVELHPNSNEAQAAKEAILRLDQEEQLKHKRLILKRYKWVFSFDIKGKRLDTLVKQMKNAIATDQKKWKFSRDVYSNTKDFIVIHTNEEQPDQAYFTQKWSQLPGFEENTNNFVLLSAQYEQVQRLKTWETITNQQQ